MVTALQRVSEVVPEGTILITDVPALTAWYTHRTTIALPAGQDALNKVLDAERGRSIGYFFTSNMPSEAKRVQDQEDKRGIYFVQPYLEMLWGSEPPQGLREVDIGTSSSRLFLPTETGTSE